MLFLAPAAPGRGRPVTPNGALLPALALASEPVTSVLHCPINYGAHSTRRSLQSPPAGVEEWELPGAGAAGCAFLAA